MKTNSICLVSMVNCTFVVLVRGITGDAGDMVDAELAQNTSPLGSEASDTGCLPEDDHKKKMLSQRI